jgi:hypothetical protein
MEAIRVVEAVFAYLREHPEELLRALRNAIALRFGLPVAALRYLAGHAKGRKAPKDLEISAVPPGVRLGGSFELMGTPLRAGAEIFVERVRLGAEELRFELRLAGVSLKVLDDRIESPLAALLRSGALDLSKPGNLVAYMPKRPAMLVDARDDRITLDLFRIPKLRDDPRLRRLAALIAPLVTVSAIETVNDHLDVALEAFPSGIGGAIEQVRRAFTSSQAPAAAGAEVG